MSEIIVRGGEVLDESGARRADVAIRDGQIVAVGDGLDGSTILDASGCLVTPGLVDLHTHLRQPGNEEAETIESGSRAAALGGYTAVLAMPNTSPAVDTASVVREVLELGRLAPCDVYTTGAIRSAEPVKRLLPWPRWRPWACGSSPTTEPGFRTIG